MMSVGDIMSTAGGVQFKILFCQTKHNLFIYLVSRLNNKVKVGGK